jgi:hypothetical protein
MKSKHLLLTGILFPAVLLQANLSSVALPGITEFEGWENLSNTNAQVAAAAGTTTTADDFPGFPGSGPWPTAIVPDGAGSAGNADFNKVSGNGYTASEAIYNFPGFPPAAPNPGDYSLDNSAPLAGLETIVFQIDVGEGNGFFDAVPILSINSGASQFSADFASTSVGRSFDNPQNPGETLTSTVFAYQWDLSSAGPIIDYSIEWGSAAHATIYTMQLDSADSFAQVVPEPSAFAAVAGALALGLVALRRRRA